LKTKTFFDLQLELFDAFSSGSLEQVAMLIEEAKEKFPAREEKLSFWKACMYSRMGESEKALTVLKEAREKGIWWNPFPLQHDPDLKNLLPYEDYQLIVAECEALFEKKEAGERRFETIGNDQSETGIVSVHWRGSNIDDFAPYWTGADEYYFGFPQSSQIYSTNMFCWDDPIKAEEELELAIQQFLTNHSFKQLLLAGASQGGKLAMKRALTDGSGEVDGFIAVVPAIRDPLEVEEWIKACDRSKRGVIMTGDLDVYHPNILSLQSMFEENGIACKFIVNEGVGHFFPKDFIHQLRESVDFILQKDEG